MDKTLTSEFKNCDFCQHHVRTQFGPHLWSHDCRLKQIEFPDAEACGAYQPPPLPEFANSGLGFVWDGEYEGRP